MSTPFGPYRLFEELGRGGSGVVYRARREDEKEDVALKQLTAGTRATDEEKRAFLRAAHTATELKFPNIVEVRDIGEIDGCVYFTMPLIAGKSLARVIADYAENGERPSPGEVATWMTKIARAVAHAHHSGVLHRDLNPSNLLIDAQGEPWIIDFGSAGLKVQPEGAVTSHPPGLTDYMAPEQALGERGQDSADIYALGVILYELLVGCVPYEGLACGVLGAELTSPDPVTPPSHRDRDVHPDLELVCLKCLKKRPAERYRSADLLAEDLEHVLRGYPPPHAQPERWSMRLGRWLMLHPTILALLGGSLLIGAVVAVAARSFARSTDELEQSALETNAFIANSYAGAVLSQLREFADRVSRASTQSPVREILSRKAMVGQAPELEPFARGFGSLYVASVEGQLLAQWPTPSYPIMGRHYGFRDYYRGARLLGEAGVVDAYLGRAYQSESTHQLQFAFSAPVLGPEREWLGNIVGALPASSAIGQVKLSGPAASGRIVALLGPRDNDRDTADKPLPSDLCFVVHPRLQRGRQVFLKGIDRKLGVAAKPGEQFWLRWVKPTLVADYHDPVMGDGQSWLAALAPVGETSYVVVVQTTRDAVLAGSRSLWRRLLRDAGIPLALGMALLTLLARSPARRRKLLARRRVASLTFVTR